MRIGKIVSLDTSSALTTAHSALGVAARAIAERPKGEANTAVGMLSGFIHTAKSQAQNLRAVVQERQERTARIEDKAGLKNAAYGLDGTLRFEIGRNGLQEFEQGVSGQLGTVLEAVNGSQPFVRLADQGKVVSVDVHTRGVGLALQDVLLEATRKLEGLNRYWAMAYPGLGIAAQQLLSEVTKDGNSLSDEQLQAIHKAADLIGQDWSGVAPLVGAKVLDDRHVAVEADLTALDEVHRALAALVALLPDSARDAREMAKEALEKLTEVKVMMALIGSPLVPINDILPDGLTVGHEGSALRVTVDTAEVAKFGESVATQAVVEAINSGHVPGLGKASVTLDGHVVAQLDKRTFVAAARHGAKDAGLGDAITVKKHFDLFDLRRGPYAEVRIDPSLVAASVLDMVGAEMSRLTGISATPVDGLANQDARETDLVLRLASAMALVVGNDLSQPRLALGGLPSVQGDALQYITGDLKALAVNGMPGPIPVLAQSEQHEAGAHNRVSPEISENASLEAKIQQQIAESFKS